MKTMPILDRDLTSLLNNTKLQTILAILPIAIFTLAMLSYFIIFFSLFGTIDSQLNNEVTSKSMLSSLLGNLIIFIFLVFIGFFVGVISFVYYIIHAVKNPNLIDSEDRLLWILAIILGNGVGIFIYWIFQIRKKDPKPIIDFHTDYL
jgi:amino acid transporter